MQEDKKLKELLNQWAMEDVPADFTDLVMKRIEATRPVLLPEASFLHPTLLWVLSVAFVALSLVLVVLSTRVQDISTPLPVAIHLSIDDYRQIICFLVVFWVVMIGNQLSKRLSF